MEKIPAGEAGPAVRAVHAEGAPPVILLERRALRPFDVSKEVSNE